MNREIKFRGKRLDNKEWVYGFYIHYQGWHYIVTPEYFNEGCSDCGSPFAVWHLVDIETVGQYTGLKDKNGKEIYEGDILQDRSGLLYLVKYNEYYAGFYIHDVFEGEVRDGISSFNEYIIKSHALKVIDNIYENKKMEVK